ncbi:hypothetical protein B0H15DRAFT_951972 [Mycena belliarum]|uniref:C2H2-type domain-containing protein n=1 Tax=Mycena belliarum TaxID=1033014 RepID=A0AAD6XLQ0_9AGAR|nr:hypothetical protein B0H15DRAFT_951972 [Mycena belliae]
MSLAHKLRKMDNLDIEKTRDDEQAVKTGETAQERQEAESSTPKSVDTPENAVPPLRPLTRSLTGRASKPRARDDSWYEAPKKNPAGRKKGKLTRKRTIDEIEDKDSDDSQAQTEPAPPEPAPTNSAVPPLTNTQAIFVDASVNSLYENRNPRSRTNLPVPVPNLIKKSRGRRVPVVAAPDGEPETNKRVHVCKVEGCGKCFHRGEHLKRHIRSIHTHEKPFPCTFPSCHKFFNRHDNLLQHVKVHRYGDDELDAEGSPVPDSPPGSPAATSTNDGFDAARIAALSLQHRSTPITYPTLGAPMTYGATTQASSYATNMAVSSLRTELPESPSKAATRASASAYTLHREQDDDDEQGERQYARVSDERQQRPAEQYTHPALQPPDAPQYAHDRYGPQPSEQYTHPPEEQQYAHDARPADEQASTAQPNADAQPYAHPGPSALPAAPAQGYVFPDAEHPPPNAASYYSIRTPPPVPEWQAQATF